MIAFYNETFSRLSKITVAFAVVLIVSSFLPSLVSAQTNYYYNGGGTGVADVTAWGTNPNGTGTNPANFSTASSVFNFTGNNGSSVVKAPTTWSVTGTGSKIVVSGGVNFIVDTLGFPAVTTIDVDTSSFLTIRDTVNVALGTLNASSTVIYDGKVAMNILPASYGNISSTNDSAYKRKFAPGRIINIAGMFTPGKATYSDSSITTFNGKKPQQIPSHSYYSLDIANPLCTVDSGSLVVIKSGGKLTVDTLETLLVKPGGTLEYHSTKTAALIGTLEVSTNANFNITAALTNVPAGIVWDSASNLNLGAGNTSVKALPKINNSDTFQNVIINAPSVILAKGAALLPATAGAYTINGNLTVLAGRVNHSGAGNAAKSLTVGGDLNIQGGTYIISDSSKNKTPDSLIVGGGVNITGGTLFLTHDTAKAYVGSAVLQVAGDFIHTAGLFGDATNSLTKGHIIFNCSDTAGQGFSSIGFTEGAKSPLTLEVSGGNEVEVLSNITANDTVIVTLGYFTVTAGNTLTLNKGVTGYNDSSYIITDAAVDSATKGALRFNNIPKNTPVIIPVGNDSTFQPVMVNTADDSSSFTVTTFNGVTKNGSTMGGAITDANTLSNMVFSTWQIARNDNGKSVVNTVFNWDSTMEGSSFTGLPDNQISIFQNNGNGWMVPIPTKAFNAKDSAVTTLNTFGYFMIANKSSVLPVHFINVQAAKVNNSVVVNWKTAEEINVANYEIERSTDGVNFTTIGSILATNISSYHFNDINFEHSTNYYRIKAINKNGEPVYSSIVRVNCTKTVSAINVYPNPVVNRTFNVSLNDLPADTYTIIVTNSIGQVLYNKQINYSGGNSITTIQPNKLPMNGMCFVKVISKDQSSTTTLLVK